MLDFYKLLSRLGNDNQGGRQKITGERGPFINRHLDNRVNVFEVASSPIFS